MERLRVAIIGAGGRAKSHFSTLRKLSDRFEVVAVCDLDPSRAEEGARYFEVKAYTDLLDMLNSERIDVGFIAVQAEGHHPIAVELAERGIHILTETPIAITNLCARRMIEAASNNGVILEVSENVPRWPRERLKQTAVRSGAIGEVRSFYLSYTSGSYHGFAGIRCIIDAEPLSVRGEFPDESTGVIERAEMSWERGISGVYEFNRNRGNYWEVKGTKGELRGGEIVIGGRALPIKLRFEGQGEERRLIGAYVEAHPPIVWENPLRGYRLSDEDDVARADAWVSLYEAVVNDKPLSYGPEKAARDVEILMAIRESASKGVEVRLPLEGVTEHERLIHEELAKVYGVDPLELTPQHLRVRYTLPGRLRELMYYGRTLRSPLF